MKPLLVQFEQNLVNSKIIDTDTSVGGTFVWLPDGMAMRNLFVEAVKKICAKYNFEENLFPTLVASGDFANMASNIKDFSRNVFWTDKDKLLLRPSGESLIYPAFKRWIKTERDLPVRVFQIGTSFRNVTPRGVFRLRESEPFIEAHTAHSTRLQAEKQVEENIRLFEEILDFMGLPAIQTQRPQWSNNPVAEKTFAFDTLMPNGETIHLNSVYQQMQIFSKPFGIKFNDKNGQKDYTYQTEFGFSARMMFACLLLTMDSKGLNFPPQIAPKQVVIVPVLGKNSEEIMAYTNKIKEALQNAGYRIVMDDDTRKSVGEKRYQYEAKGIPLRIEIGQNETQESTVTIISRETNERVKVPLSTIEKQVGIMLDETLKKIKLRLSSRHILDVIRSSSAEDIQATIEGGKIATYPLCFDEKCSNDIEKKARGEVLGYNHEEIAESCVVCNKPTEYVAYQARHI